MDYRTESDSLGEFQVPADALYGPQTARAVDNFPISGNPLPPSLISALGLVKLAAARVNKELGYLDPRIADAIEQAAREVADGKLNEHFPVDIFQTGSGTSSNMNANEVIANRAITTVLGGKLGDKDIHPNDHVNFGQSSNDSFPTAIHVAAMVLVEKELIPALEHLQASLERKAVQFDDVVKIGRTHLQDATPVRMGQEFAGYASQIEHGIGHVKDATRHLRELAQGGTAVGTGINTHPEFGKRMAAELTKLTGVEFQESDNHFEGQAAQDAAVQMSGSLKTVAQAFIKIANDIRWLGSGPRLGLGELILPAVQPGSSIMPGKVNPVIAESAIMASAQVIANDHAITFGGLYGNFQLNVMMPLIAANLLEQLGLLSASARNFADQLVDGLEANVELLNARNEQSLSLATSLAPRIGYDAAAKIAKQSYETGKTVRELAMEQKVLPVDELELLLNLRTQTDPGV